MNKVVTRNKVIIIAIALCVVVGAVFAAFTIPAYALGHKYDDLVIPNGSDGDGTVTLNDVMFTCQYRYGADSFSDIPEGFTEISPEDNDIAADDLGSDVAVYASAEYPDVIFARSANSEYRCLVNNEVLYAHLVYDGKDYCYNYLTCLPTTEPKTYSADSKKSDKRTVLPDDMTALSSDKFTIDILEEYPAYVSDSTGMVYFEVLKDYMYIPFERVEALYGAYYDAK